MLEKITIGLESFLSVIGRAIAYLVLFMAALVCFELVSRWFFSTSQPWVHDVSAWLLTAFVFLGGPYALLRGAFVRVDVLYGALRPRVQLWLDTVVSTLLVLLFLYVLIGYGKDFFMSSFKMNERSATGSWGGPVWVAKMFVPMGGFLLLLAWITHLLKSWQKHLASDQ